MPEVRLAADPGRRAGSRSSRRLRTAGRVPAVIYGHGMDPVPVSVDGRELRIALSGGAGLNALLSLQVGGTSHLAMARELQRDPVRGTVAHVDFQVVRRDEVVATDVQVILFNEATLVHQGDGVVEQVLMSLTVSSTPDRIPHSIEVDISELAIGDTIRVADIGLPEGVTTDLDPEEAVVVAQGQQAVETVEVAEAEAAETAEAQAAGGPTEAPGSAGGTPQG